MNLFLFIIATVLALNQAYRQYENYQVFRFVPRTRSQLAFLRRLAFNRTFQRDSSTIDFWSHPTHINHSVDVLLSSQARRDLSSTLERRKLKFTILIDNVQKLVNEEKARMSGLRFRSTEMSTKEFFSEYQRLTIIQDFMIDLERKYSDLITIQKIGYSHEGRPILMARISYENSTRIANRKKVFLDAGFHAREWIGPATLLYIMNQLVQGVNDVKVRELLDEYDFFIVPVTNPDGYEYTHTNDRMWRKNRGKTRSFWGWSSCHGTDLNRNFDFHWRERGASSNPCSDIYAGQKAFSEPETRAISKVILQHKGDWKLYISFHSYSQMILLPWGYTSKLPPTYNEMQRVASIAAEEMASRGTTYKVGTATRLLYPAAGGSDDWAHGVAGIPYSYTFELRDTGDYGFLLPANQILSTGDETYEALKAILRNMEQGK